MSGIFFICQMSMLFFEIAVDLTSKQIINADAANFEKGVKSVTNSMSSASIDRISLPDCRSFLVYTRSIGNKRVLKSGLKHHSLYA